MHHLIIDEINNYYNANPPKKIIDDLGIHHEVEVPLPAKYLKTACRCGIIHKWEQSSTFRLENLKVSLSSEVSYKVIKKCISCEEILFLELYHEN